ncbi:MAG: hypothetical protein PHG71_01135, partial [Kiritimatiellae bacterium]|nr:hypothetical protein [Kiritimatiellia bacterium]
MKKSCLKPLCPAVAFMALAITAFATDAVWTNTVSKSASWTNGVDWTDGLGNPLVYAPTNGEDIVISALDPLPAASAYIPDSGMNGMQTINTGATANNAARTGEIDPVIGAVTGDERHTIQIDALFNSGTFVYFRYLPKNPTDGVAGRYLDIANPNGFTGYWSPYGVFSRLLLHPAAGFTPVLHNLSSACRPVVCVPGEGLRAEIGNLYGGGTLDKTGAGELAINSTGGEKTRIILSGGSIELAGKASDELSALLNQAALHLDASDDTTLTKVADSDGLMVTRWDDVRKNGIYAGHSDFQSASEYFLPYCTNPLFRASATAKGMPLIDFGAKPGVIGRSNCVHKIYPNRIAGVRAAFYVADHPDKAGKAMVLGDIGGLPFMCGDSDTALYSSRYSDPAVRYADITLNL